MFKGSRIPRILICLVKNMIDSYKDFKHVSARGLFKIKDTVDLRPGKCRKLSSKFRLEQE